MPSLELAAGQVLTAAHTNTYWMRQVVATGLSSARPTGYEGRVIYDTDTDALNVYTTATTGWQPPWNLPWGHVASSLVTTSVGGVAASTTVNLTTVTFSAVQGRRYRVTAQVYAISASVANSFASLTIQDGGSVNVVQQVVRLGDNAGDSNGATLVGILAAAASGSVTFKLTLTTAASGTTDVGAAATAPIMLMVEDMGPATAPA